MGGNRRPASRRGPLAGPLQALALAAALAGCGDAAITNPPARAAASLDEATRARLIAHLRGDAPGDLREAAGEIVARGDAETRRAASAQLVAQAQIVTSPAFRDWQRGRISMPDATPAEIQAEVDRQQDMTLSQIFTAMGAVGGPEVVAYCLVFADNEAAPYELRRAALMVLVRHVDRSDPALTARGAALWEKLKAPRR
jgi:hypothetical protein